MWCQGAFVLVFVGVTAGGRTITCPDGLKCSDYSTCCKTPNGYHCCIYPKAVCCSDLAHCCPHGFLCDSATQMCVRAGHPLHSLAMRPKSVPGDAGSALTPLRPSRPRGQSAVLGQGGAEERGSVGVRCGEEDGGVPCPADTRCCRRPGGAWLCCPVSAERNAGLGVMGVTRCDASFSCPAITSCCKSSTGAPWSCCPYPLAYCCSDGPLL